MATFDQLSAEQRAIIELVLKQGQSYGELSDMLDLSTARVRELGRDALVRLSPVSAKAVDPEWRDQLSDYLLNQQVGVDATATRGHLRRSEESRAWARSVLDSLEQFYDDSNLPQIPAGDGEGKAEKEKEPRRAPSARRSLSPEARRMLRNRRVLGGAALALVALFAIFVWPISVLGGDDDEKKERAAQPQARIEGQLVLTPVGGAAGSSSNAGLAVIARQGKRQNLIVQAQLRPVRDREAYEVWLYNSKTDARSLGAQVTDRQGAFQGAGPLPADYRKFKFIDISREPVNQDGKHSGNSVLRGRIADIQAPPRSGQGAAR